MKGITIADVARAAEVSPASVSRFLNGVQGNLAPRTAERIARAIADLDYRPNAWARSLKTHHSGLVAAVVADLTNAFTPALLDGVETQINGSGYSLMIGNSQNDPALENVLIERLLNQRVEGILLQTSSPQVTPALQAVLSQQIPLVLVDRILAGAPELDRVGLDNQGAIGVAMTHLFAQGYRTLAYVTEPVDGISSRQERQQEVVRQSSVWERVNVISIADDEVSGLALRIRNLVAAGRPGSVAVLCANSVAALTAISAVMAEGLRVPQDVGFMMIDDPPWTRFVFGGISAVEQPTGHLGRYAAQCLIQRISQPQTGWERTVLPGILNVRRSTQRLTKSNMTGKE